MNEEATPTAEGRAAFSYHIEALEVLRRNPIAINSNPTEVIHHLEGAAKAYLAGTGNRQEVSAELTKLAQNLLSTLNS